MADRTSIEWAANADGTPGATWNPIRAARADEEGARIGFHCVHVSEGCRNCYAERLNMSPRFPGHGTGLPYAKQSEAKVRVFLDEERLAIPLRRRKPTTYFLSSMTDVFADFVTDDMLDRLFAVMALSPQHTFIVLTKRADRMRAYFTAPNGPPRNRGRLNHPWERIEGAAFDWLDANGGGRSPAEDWIANGGVRVPLPNVWLGVSVEDQATADERIPLLLDTPAAIRCLSAEPLLGPVDLTRIPMDRISPEQCGAEECCGGQLYGDALDNRFAYCNGPCDPESVSGNSLDWVICGGESGPNARPMHPDWARSLRDQCAAAGVPFFFKQWGEWIPLEVSGRDAFWPTDTKAAVRLNADNSRAPDGWPLQRVGKARAGRLLDGIEHNGRPPL